VNNKWLKKYFQTSVDVQHWLVDCTMCLPLCACVCVCVCVLDTWSLNRVFRMPVSVYFSVQGSLQRSSTSLRLENKHIKTHTVIFLSAGSGTDHTIAVIIITAKLWQM